MTEIMVINRIFHQAHKKQAQDMAKNSRVGETHKKTGFLPLKNLEFLPILPWTSQPVNKHTSTKQNAVQVIQAVTWLYPQTLGWSQFPF